METKYDLGQTIYLPFEVYGIEIYPEDKMDKTNSAKIRYTIEGLSAVKGNTIRIYEDDCDSGWFRVKTLDDFK